MRIARLEVIWLKVPLVTPFRTSFGTAHDKDTFLVRLETTDGTVGWAECAAELDPLYSAEWLDGCEQVLRRELVPRLLALGDQLTAGRVATAHRDLAGDCGGRAPSDDLFDPELADHEPPHLAQVEDLLQPRHEQLLRVRGVQLDPLV